MIDGELADPGEILKCLFPTASEEEPAGGFLDKWSPEE